MKKLIVLIPFLVLAWVVAALLTGRVANVRAQEAMTCSWTFDATIREGPNMGVIMAGDLTISIDGDGALTGMLAMQDGKSVNVAGQVVGRAINLAIEAQPASDGTQGMYIFGTGTAWQPISPDMNCGGTLGGTFSGPQPGDIGDWLGCVKVKRTSLLLTSYHAKPALGAAECG